MTIAARWRLAESQAKALYDALADEPDIDAVDLSEIRGGGFEVVAYCADHGVEARLSAIAAAALGKDAGPAVEALADEDWVARSLSALPPVRSGRFLVHGSHDRAAMRTNDIAIEIDAGLAFGTGHHGTTVGCLMALERLARRTRPQSVLDIGTGSGVLAIAAAKLWHVPVVATEIDPVATKVAAKNAGLNGVGCLVEAVTANGLRHPDVRGRRFDLTMANILARPLADLAGPVVAHLEPGGTAILSGLLPAQRRWITAAYRNRGLVFRRAVIVDDWLTMVVERPRGIADGEPAT